MLRIKAPKAIIFDKDGTLIDVHHYWIMMSELRIKYLTKKILQVDTTPNYFDQLIKEKLGIDKESKKINKNGPAGVLPKIEIIAVVKKALNELGYDLTVPEIEEVFQLADIQSKQNLTGFLKLLVGVEDLISLAIEKKIDLNLVSNDITERSKLALEKLGFLNYFKYVLGQDEVKNAKPSADLANMVLLKGCYKGNEVINIGDHPNDIKMGLNAGISCNIALLTGLSNKEDFSNLDCIILNSLNELKLD